MRTGKIMGTRLLVGTVVLAVIVAGSAGATLRPAQSVSTPPAGSIAADATSADRLQGAECNYTRLYDDVSTSVVEILAHNRTAAWGGSGWIYRIDGSTAYVVTNWHMVELGNPTDVDVRFEGGRWIEAEVVGTNDLTDIGVVRVENVSESATALPLVEDPVERGQPVAVFGQPFLYKESITRGIVSGVNRSITFIDPDGVNRTTAPMIQTDAGIEPGNSGGPWVNCRGEVLGMTVGGYFLTTVNFGISSRALGVIVPALIANGSYRMAYLGVNVTEVDAIVAEVNDLNTTRGVMLNNLTADSPAQGVLRPAPAVDKQFGIPYGGDVILAVDGVRIEDEADLFTYLYLETRPSETVTFTVLRDGRRRTVEVNLGEYPTLPTPSTNGTTTTTQTATTPTTAVETTVPGTPSPANETTAERTE